MSKRRIRTHPGTPFFCVFSGFPLFFICFFSVSAGFSLIFYSVPLQSNPKSPIPLSETTPRPSPFLVIRLEQLIIISIVCFDSLRSPRLKINLCAKKLLLGNFLCTAAPIILNTRKLVLRWFFLLHPVAAEIVTHCESSQMPTIRFWDYFRLTRDA